MTTPCVRGSSLKDAMHPPGEPSDTKVANSTTIGIFAVTILAVSAKALSGGGAISAEGFVDPATGIAFSPSEGKLGLMGVQTESAENRCRPVFHAFFLLMGICNVFENL